MGKQTNETELLRRLVNTWDEMHGYLDTPADVAMLADVVKEARHLLAAASKPASGSAQKVNSVFNSVYLVTGRVQPIDGDPPVDGIRCEVIEKEGWGMVGFRVTHIATGLSAKSLGSRSVHVNQLIARRRLAAILDQNNCGQTCPVCNGDCAGANPPVMNCPNSSK